jgi:hypothetical protein
MSPTTFITSHFEGEDSRELKKMKETYIIPTSSSSSSNNNNNNNNNYYYYYFK